MIWWWWWWGSHQFLRSFQGFFYLSMKSPQAGLELAIHLSQSEEYEITDVPLYLASTCLFNGANSSAITLHTDPTLQVLTFWTNCKIFKSFCSVFCSWSHNQQMAESSQEYPYHSLNAELPCNFLHEINYPIAFKFSLPQILRTRYRLNSWASLTL